MTGDEWPVTGHLVEAYMLPALAAHGVRFAQVARHGPRQADGITILDDSTSPTELYLDGDYKLSDELRASGTVPQVGGARKCSMKAKGVPIEEYILNNVHGSYRHVMGFEANELSRAVRDAAYDTDRRTGAYPLLEWGWDREQCERYIHELIGVWWPKSCCVYCPFALCNADGRARTLEGFAADPVTALLPLDLELAAVSLNHRQTLTPADSLASLLQSSGRHGHVYGAWQAHLDEVPWRVYEVRRVYRRPANAVRRLEALAEGSRQEMAGELRGLAFSQGLPLQPIDGIARAWVRHRQDDVYPTAEHFYVAAPAGPADKLGPGFDTAWASVLASGTVAA
jgi:hypothetical protein